MNKVILIFIVSLFTAIYILSSVDSLMKKVAQYRYKENSIFGSDKYTYGDLYGMSYLPSFKIKDDNVDSLKLSKPTVNGDINLYSLVDSYIYKFTTNKAPFYGVKNYWYSRWYRDAEFQKVKINTGEKNVLLIEVVEREVRSFADSNFVLHKLLVTNEKSKISIAIKSQSKSVIKDAIFNKLIDENLEFNLFNYRFFTPLKELKATLNYKIFNRVDKDVRVSTDGKYLFYAPTADTSKNSSFAPVNDVEIDKIVTSLNAVNAHYKALGFDKVYFNIMPNPVSIVDPLRGNYNDLIRRIQNNPKLQIETIDVYGLFKKCHTQIYCSSDAHYNYKGFNMWLAEFNKKLMAEAISTKPK